MSALTCGEPFVTPPDTTVLDFLGLYTLDYDNEKANACLQKISAKEADVALDYDIMSHLLRKIACAEFC